MYNILICDDEKDIVRALRIYLSSHQDYCFFEAYDGLSALQIVREQQIHLLLLDIMMPKMDGISVLSRLREEKNIPVILISAKGESDDVVMGLNAGADDYITKPFKPSEVQARVASALRRYTQLGALRQGDNIYRFESIMLDDNSRIVEVDQQPVTLTPTEYGILKLLIQHPGTVFSTDEIYESVWQENSLGNEQSVAVHIRHLREKIEIDPSNPRYLKVIWGVGYCLRKDGKQ